MISLALLVISCAIAACSGDISAGVPPGFVPYHATVYGKAANIFDPNVTDYSFLCSGAIIATDAVLTTASCADITVFESQGLAVVVGFLDRFDADIVYLDVAEIRKHDAYVEGEKTNDIAVLKLGSGLTLSENVQTIGVRESSAVGVGTACTLSGWRKDLITLSPVLRYSNVTILEEAECHDKVDAEICAGAPTDASAVGCQLGDEGSPVSCEFVLTGLMHYSTSTCLSDPEPGVFGDVFYHAAWIKAQLAAESPSSPSTSTTSLTSTAVPSSTSAASTSTEPTSTETVISTSTPAPAPTYDPDHPTGQLFSGAGTLASSMVAVVLLAVGVALTQ